jgi:hypothetical protein
MTTYPIDALPRVRADHLRRLTGRHGLYEHARHNTPRISHGHTTDDNARALVVLSTAFPHRAEGEAFEPYLRFVVSGKVEGGWHNRMSHAGVWTDRRGSDDAHGRAIWGLGFVIGSGYQPEAAVEALRIGLRFTSQHPRAVSYAVLGAVAALGSGPVDSAAERFLSTALPRLPEPRVGSWRWPEERLSYANARIPEAMIRAGHALGDSGRLQTGLDLLAWLIETERGERGFSFTPVGGRGPDDPRPAVDQQPRPGPWRTPVTPHSSPRETTSGVTGWKRPGGGSWGGTTSVPRSTRPLLERDSMAWSPTVSTRTEAPSRPWRRSGPWPVSMS